MGYDRGDSFSFDFETNGIPFGSKSRGKLSPRSYPIQFKRKWNTSFLSVSFFTDMAANVASDNSSFNSTPELKEVRVLFENGL